MSTKIVVINNKPSSRTVFNVGGPLAETCSPTDPQNIDWLERARASYIKILDQRLSGIAHAVICLHHIKGCLENVAHYDGKDGSLAALHPPKSLKGVHRNIRKSLSQIPDAYKHPVLGPYLRGQTRVFTR